MRIRNALWGLGSAALLTGLTLANGATPTLAAQTETVQLAAAAVTASPGQSISYHITGALAGSDFQFRVETPAGHWYIARRFTSDPSFTLAHLHPGTYEIEGAVLSTAQVAHRRWNQAVATGTDTLYVNANVTATVTQTSQQETAWAVVTASSKNIQEPLYQLQWQSPQSNLWQFTQYQASPVFRVPVTVAGNYQFRVAAISQNGSANPADQVLSTVQTANLSVPAATVTLSPATATLTAGSQGVDPVSVRVWDSMGQPIANFSGSVTIMDSASELVGPSGTTNMLVVPIRQGTGSFSVMAQTSAGLDSLTAQTLTANAGSVTAAAVTYESAAIQSRAAQSGINSLTTIQTVASTVDAQNGDKNPYGLTQDTYAGTPTSPNPFEGDFLVTNFSNSAGVNGAGTTIEAINPTTGAVTQFSHSVSGPVALAVSPKGPPWVADFGTNGTNGNDAVLTPVGGTFPNGGSFIQSSLFAGPWGEVFVPNATTPAFFVTNVLNGSIDALYGFAPPNFNTDTEVSVIGSGLAHQGTSASTVEGPQGMVYDPATHMVYVTDSADNSIRGFVWNGPETANQSQGTLIYQGGALNRPAGITLDPLNGDLLVVNQGNNNLVEINLNNGNAYVQGQKVLDPTPVNPITGAGSALFGVDAVVNNGQLNVYFTDDNTNTLDVLK